MLTKLKHEDVQSTEATETSAKKLPKIKNKKRLIIIAVVAVLIAAIVMKFLPGGKQAGVPSLSYTEAQVSNQTITKSLTGSGTLQPANSYTVTTLVSGEILSDHFEEGDIVQKDQPLYTIDSSDAATSTSQAQNNYEDALKSKYPTADMTGVISEVYVKNGDSITAGTQICKITGGSAVSADFQFSYVDSSKFYVGQSARIYLDNFEEPVAGTVQQVGSSGVVSGEIGRVMTSVRVTFENPGMVTESSVASAVIGNYTSYGWTELRVGTTSIVTASVSGKIADMKYMPGDSIESGTKLCTITGDSIDRQIENALTSLENAQDRLEDYQVTSPIYGTVVEKNAKSGDNIATGNGANTLCIIYDLSYLEMTLNIDELDISTVEVGQAVQIIADAVPNQTYSGVVTKVSVVGSTAGGITSYPVTVRLDQTDGLLPGMNVDAEIVLAQAENALAIPASAVVRGNGNSSMVLVTENSPSAANAEEQEAPEGYVYVKVETGVSDDNYVQILSGLQEGDSIAYIARTTSGDDFMMGMMPGGMPGGGMPGGGGMPSGGGGMPGGGGGFPG